MLGFLIRYCWNWGWSYVFGTHFGSTNPFHSFTMEPIWGVCQAFWYNHPFLGTSIQKGLRLPRTLLAMKGINTQKEFGGHLKGFTASILVTESCLGFRVTHPMLIGFTASILITDSCLGFRVTHPMLIGFIASILITDSCSGFRVTHPMLIGFTSSVFI